MLLPHQQQRVLSYHKALCLSTTFLNFLFISNCLYNWYNISCGKKKTGRFSNLQKGIYPQNHILNFIRFLPKPSWLSPRPISDSQLHVLPHFHLCPIYLVVFKGSYYLRMGYLILRGASRLDAFSVYSFRTWLPGDAIGMTAGTPVVRPARSSRTKASSPQISYARAG